MRKDNGARVILAGSVLLCLGMGGTKRSSRLLANEPGVMPFVQLSPPSLIFGAVTVGNASPPRAVKVTNNSASSVNILSISIIGPQASDFFQTNNCGGVLAAGAGCVVDVTFKPTATGIRTAHLKIADGPPAAIQYVSLQGTGV
jgi:hypothetical protein